jgi:hypothetical protein
MGISSLNVYGRISAKQKHTITLEARLGKAHNVQSEKIRDGVISGIKFTKVCFKGKFTAKFKGKPKMPNNCLRVRDKRKTSKDHLYKTDATESIGDIRICLWHHLPAKTICSSKNHL